MANKWKEFSDSVGKFFGALFGKKKPKAPAEKKKKRSLLVSAVKKPSGTSATKKKSASETDAPKSKQTLFPKIKRRLPRSIRKKRGYWKLFYFTFGFIFIIAGAIYILFFVAQHDPKMFGLTKEYNAEAKAYIEAGDYENAEIMLDKSLAIDHANSDAIIMLADIYRLQERYSSELDILLEGITHSVNSENVVFYRRIVQAYVAQNLIGEACDFCNGLSSYMTRQLAEIRPSNIQASKDPGVYSSAVTVKLTIPEDATVYYTLDGTFPDVRNSKVYSADDEGIIVNRGNVTVRAIALGTNGMLSNPFEATYMIYSDNSPYDFVDEKVEEIVRLMLGRSGDDNIYYKDLSKITEFTNDVSGLSGKTSIRSLEDLTVFVNLRTVELINEPDVADYTVLNRSTSLQLLRIEGTPLTETSLSQIFGLTALPQLELMNDEISRLTQIVSMKQLTYLNLSDNFITDVSPLASLDHLTSLDISDNRISELSMLSALTTLETLDLSNNAGVTSLEGIRSLRNLRTLTVSGIPLAEIEAVSSLRNLKTLTMNDARVKSLVPLSFCTQLTTLDISGTPVESLEGLSGTALVSLTAENCGLTDLTGLGSLRRLTTLDLAGNELTSVKPLEGCAGLTNLNINGNSAISDMSALLACENLDYIECSGVTVPGSVMSNFAEHGVTVVQ